MKEVFKEIELPEIKLPQLKGHTVIELTDVNTGEVERIEDDNLVTNALTGFMTNLFRLQNYSFINYSGTSGTETYSYDWRRIKNLLCGLFIFNTALAENANNIYIPDPSTSKMVGYAGEIVSDGYDPHRGDYNMSESEELPNGYKFVWDFGTDDANGQVACVCLTNPIAGYHGYHIKRDVDLSYSNIGEYKSNKPNRYRGSNKSFNSSTDYTNYFRRVYTDMWTSHGIFKTWKEDGNVFMESLYPLSTTSTNSPTDDNYKFIHRIVRISLKTFRLKGYAETSETILDERIQSTPFEMWNVLYDANYKKTLMFCRPQNYIFDAGTYLLQVVISNYPRSQSSHSTYRYMESATIYYRYLDKTTFAPIANTEHCVELPYTINNTSDYHGNYYFWMYSNYTCFCINPVFYRDGKLYIFPRKYNNERVQTCFKIDLSTDTYTILYDNLYGYAQHPEYSGSSYVRAISFMSKNKTIFFGPLIIDRNDVIDDQYFTDTAFRDIPGGLYTSNYDSYANADYGNRTNAGNYETFYLDDGLVLVNGRGVNNLGTDVYPDIWYLATINNLPEPIQKTPSKTMKITYTITEASS